MPSFQSHIVVFKPEVPRDEIAKHAKEITDKGGKIKHEYYTSANPILNGFSADIPDDHISALSTSDKVAYTEPDGTVKTQ